MSYEIKFTSPDESPDTLFLGSTSDVGAFSAWASDLPEEYPAIRTLATDGKVKNTVALSDQLKTATTLDPPDDEGAQGIIERLREIIGEGDSDETAHIDDGVNGEEGEGD